MNQSTGYKTYARRSINKCKMNVRYKIKLIVLCGIEQINITNNNIYSNVPISWCIDDKYILYIMPITKKNISIDDTRPDLIMFRDEFRIQNIQNIMNCKIHCRTLIIESTNHVFSCNEHENNLCIIWEKGIIYKHGKVIHNYAEKKYCKIIPRCYLISKDTCIKKK